MTVSDSNAAAKAAGSLESAEVKTKLEKIEKALDDVSEALAKAQVKAQRPDGAGEKVITPSEAEQKALAMKGTDAVVFAVRHQAYLHRLLRHPQ